MRGIRPPVITPELATQLSDFLGFRDLFRNNYGDELDPAWLAALEKLLPGLLEDFETQIRVFLAWMTGLSPD